MFVMTLNKGGLKKAAAVGVCVLALAAGAVGLGLMGRDDAVETAAPAVASQQITGAQDLRTFLAGYGLEVDPTTAQVNTVTVPRKWDDNFKAFHDVVEQSGLSLAKCKGKEVDKWMVPLPSESTDTSTTFAVVLVYDGEARGAYLLSEPSGEVHALMPAQSSAAVQPAQATEDTVMAAAQSAAQASAQADSAAQAAQATADSQAAQASAQAAQDAQAVQTQPVAPTVSDGAAATAADTTAQTAADAGAVPVE